MAQTLGRIAWLLPTLALVVGCRDLSRFSTGRDRFEGSVIDADFVRVGMSSGVRLCLTLDTDHLQDSPGAISTTDGRFSATPLRPIPQIWHDPLSTLTFGDGRIQNLFYVVTPASDSGDTGDINTVVSLMDSGGIEVRLLRGAPPLGGAPDSATSSTPSTNLFAVFTLDRQQGPCSY
jgi:hypothetical protein